MLKLALILSVLLVTACKPKLSKLSSENADTGDSCLATIPSAEQIDLQKSVEERLRDMLEGKLSVEVVRKELAEQVKQRSGGDPKKEAALALAGSEFAQSVTAAPILAAAIDVIEGRPIPQKISDLVASLKVTDEPRVYIDAVAKMFGSYHACLTKTGASFKEGQWDLIGAKFSKEDIRQNACLRTTLGLFYGAGSVSETGLASSEALVIGDAVIRPAKGYIVISRTEWEQGLKNTLDRFNREFVAFLTASGQASSYSSMIRAGGGWWKGGEATSAAAISKEGAYKMMIGYRDSLRNQGAGSALITAINNAMKAAVDKDSANIEVGIKKLISAQWAGVAVLALVPIIAALPYVVAGSLVAGSLVNAAAGSVFVGIAFAMGSATVISGKDTWRHGGKFFCNLAENIAVEGAHALQMAPFLAALPVASYAAGASAVSYLGPSLGTRVYGAARVATALGFVGSMGRNSVNELRTCHSMLEDVMSIADKASSQADVDKANVVLTQAIDMCLRGGVDLAFTAQSILHLLKPRGQQQKSDCLSLAGPCDIDGKKIVVSPRANDLLAKMPELSYSSSLSPDAQAMPIYKLQQLAKSLDPTLPDPQGGVQFALNGIRRGRGEDPGELFKFKFGGENFAVGQKENGGRVFYNVTLDDAGNIASKSWRGSDSREKWSSTVEDAIARGAFEKMMGNLVSVKKALASWKAAPTDNGSAEAFHKEYVLFLQKVKSASN